MQSKGEKKTEKKKINRTTLPILNHKITEFSKRDGQKKSQNFISLVISKRTLPGDLNTKFLDRKQK